MSVTTHRTTKCYQISHYFVDQCHKKALWARKLPLPKPNPTLSRVIISIRTHTVLWRSSSSNNIRILLVGVINICTCDKYLTRYVSIYLVGPYYIKKSKWNQRFGYVLKIGMWSYSIHCQRCWLRMLLSP